MSWPRAIGSGSRGTRVGLARISLALALIGLAFPVSAQTTPPEPRPERPGLVERGAEQLLRRFFNEFELELREADLPERLAMLRELVDLMHDVENYDPPLQLPNGDILIRRRPEAPTPAEPETGPDGEIDL